jgi:hypothetical protein
MGSQYNGTKIMRYWHTNIWRDDDVACPHYIVDKPWVGRVSEDGVASYKRLDGRHMDGGGMVMGGGREKERRIGTRRRSRWWIW